MSKAKHRKQLAEQLLDSLRETQEDELNRLRRGRPYSESSVRLGPIIDMPWQLVSAIAVAGRQEANRKWAQEVAAMRAAIATDAEQVTSE